MKRPQAADGHDADGRPPSCGRRLRRALVALGLTLVFWLVFTWPLPRYVTAGIPSSSLNVEKYNARRMIPGDHLQFLYQFWLAGEVFRGEVAPFHNVYEFNTGDDAERRGFTTYYLPFALTFILGDRLGGQAVGWNLTALVSLWLTFLFTWMLTRRFVRDPVCSLLAAALSLIFPFRWIALLDASPTGLTLMWVPLMFWALDVMVADRKAWAGAAAGAAIYFSSWADTHVFFFCLLSAPFWAWFSYVHHAGRPLPRMREWAPLIRAAVPLLLFLVLVAVQVWQMRREVAKTEVAAAGGWSLHDVALWSPPLSGAVTFRHATRKIYLGWPLIILLAVGWGTALGRLCRRAPSGARVPLGSLLLLQAAVVGVALLSAGVHNPGRERAWLLLTRLVPPYKMIRQPDKVYALMPFLLAVNAALLLRPLAAAPPRRRLLAALLLLAPVLADYQRRIAPTICLLDREQGAYAAVRADADARGVRPHLLALPLWPGDSHYTSLNEYYVSLYRIRMVNGYGGAVMTEYRRDIFDRFETMNLGYGSDEQLDALLRRGVGYLVLHEDVFPEKVSPFPVGVTLAALLNHPRLTCIGQDQAVWAFRILPRGAAAAEPKPGAFVPFYGAARRWEFERQDRLAAEARLDEPGAANRGYLELSKAGASVVTTPAFTRYDLPLTWLACGRGEGVLAVASAGDAGTNATGTLTLSSPEWRWQAVAVPPAAGAGGLTGRFDLLAGQADLDVLLLSGGTWDPPAAGEAVEWPATAFFHAGYTTRALDAVAIRKDYDYGPEAEVLYGPLLPLERGTYESELLYSCAAPAGTRLGWFYHGPREQAGQHGTPVIAGGPARLSFAQADNEPLRLAFIFEREADMRIRAVRTARTR